MSLAKENSNIYLCFVFIISTNMDKRNHNIASYKLSCSIQLFEVEPLTQEL